MSAAPPPPSSSSATQGRERARPRRRTLLVAVLLSAVSLSGLSGVAGQPRAVRGVEITPSRLEVDLASRKFRVKTLIVNHERSPRRIALSVAGLGHDLDGVPRFIEPGLASTAVRLSARRFVLGAGRRRQFVASGSVPRGHRGLYAAVIAEFAPLRPPGGLVRLRSRVASLYLIRGPRPWRESIRVVDVGMQPGPRRADPLIVHAAARNTGNVHVRPRGRVRIVHQGRTLDVVRLRGQTIIPGFARRLTGRWKPPPGLTGKVNLEARLREPRAVGTGQVEFFDGTLRVPAAEIEDLVARERGGALVSFSVANTGNVPISPLVTLEAAEGDERRAHSLLHSGEIGPGEREAMAWRPDLATGRHLITVRLTVGDKLLDEAATALEVKGMGLLPWLALALLALALLLLAWTRRRGRGFSLEAPVHPLPVEGGEEVASRRTA